MGDGAGQDKLLGVKTQLIETQTALDNKSQECKKIDTQLATAREEVRALQFIQNFVYNFVFEHIVNDKSKLVAAIIRDA